MQRAIITKYFGPTNTCAARIKATCAGSSLTVSYDHALDLDAQCHAAAIGLCRKLGWGEVARLHSGILPNGEFAHILERQRRP